MSGRGFGCHGALCQRFGLSIVIRLGTALCDHAASPGSAQRSSSWPAGPTSCVSRSVNTPMFLLLRSLMAVLRGAGPGWEGFGAVASAASAVVTGIVMLGGPVAGAGRFHVVAGSEPSERRPRGRMRYPKVGRTSAPGELHLLQGSKCTGSVGWARSASRAVSCRKAVDRPGAMALAVTILSPPLARDRAATRATRSPPVLPASGRSGRQAPRR